MGTLESLVSLRLRAINDSEAATAAELCNCTVRSAEILIVARGFVGKRFRPPNASVLRSNASVHLPPPIQIHLNVVPKAFDFNLPAPLSADLRPNEPTK